MSFVPNERIFMCGEYAYSLKAVMNFIAPYRAAIGGCVAGQGDVMVGAAALMARANGLSEKVFRDKLTQMTINNETTFGMGVAAGVLGAKHPSGVWIPNTLLSNVNKVHVATFPMRQNDSLRISLAVSQKPAVYHPARISMTHATGNFLKNIFRQIALVRHERKSPG